jgi:hypothetical protein
MMAAVPTTTVPTTTVPTTTVPTTTVPTTTVSTTTVSTTTVSTTTVFGRGDAGAQAQHSQQQGGSHNASHATSLNPPFHVRFAFLPCKQEREKQRQVHQHKLLEVRPLEVRLELLLPSNFRWFIQLGEC